MPPYAVMIYDKELVMCTNTTNNGQQVTTKTVNKNTNINTTTNVNALQNVQTTRSASQIWADKIRTDQDVTAGNDAQNILSEFNETKHISSKSQDRRNKAFQGKKGLYDSASATAWRTGKAAPAQPAQPAAPPKQQVPYPYKEKLLEFLDESIDFMGYKDDREFVSHFSEMYEKLKSYAVFTDVIANMTKDEYKALDAACEKKLPFFGALKEKVAYAKNCKEYYEAKMDLISNPFYMVLKQTDTKKVSIEKLKEKKASSHTDGRKDMEDYLDAIIRLKTLKADKELFHERGKQEKHDKAVHRAEIKDGYDKKNKGYFEVLSFKPSMGYTMGTEGDGFGRGGDMLNGMSDIEDMHSDAFTGFETGLYGQGAVKGKIVKGSYKYKRSNFEFGANASAGGLGATAAAGGKIGYSEGLKWQLGGEGVIDGQLGKTRVKAKVHAFHQLFGLDGKLVGKAGSGYAGLYAKGGKYKIRTAEGTKDVDNGFAVYAGAEASLLSGTGSFGITFLGVRFGVDLTGQVGAIGASAGLYCSTGSLGASLGACFGLGGKINLSLDFSVLRDLLFKNAIKPAAKAGGRLAVKGAKAAYKGAKDAYHWMKKKISGTPPAQPAGTNP